MIPLRSGKVESSVYALAWRDAVGLGTPEQYPQDMHGESPDPLAGLSNNR